MRAFAFIVAAAAHIALLVLLATDNRAMNRQSRASKSQLVFVQAERPAEPRWLIAPPAMTKPSIRPQNPLEPLVTSPPVQRSASSSAAIDWAREAELSVSRQIAAAEAARRAAEMFSRKPLDEPLRPVPEFGWLHSAVQPIEALPEGGFIVWLNERCGIFVGIMAMPFCGFGKIPARGDLFEHMTDVPQAGDWKD